jgi:hypothetical protein
MPSPFPGMDPFIESQLWPDFHTSLMPIVRELLMPVLLPSYVCQVERHVYVMTDEEEIERHLVPDAYIAGDNAAFPSSGAGQIATPVPKLLTLPNPLELRQSYLTIRTIEGREVVTVIELLSPWNKSKSEGWSEYLTKRREYFHASANVVEIDLLRGGERLPCREPLPEGDYFCYVSRPEQRPRVGVYSWSMRDRLPAIPIPLRSTDDDVALDLQEAFNRLYDRAVYRSVINYYKPVSPPLTQAEQAWVTQRILAWRS